MRLTEALVRAFEQLAPLLVVDDLQWCDGATLEWLACWRMTAGCAGGLLPRSTELAGAPQELVSDLELAGRLQTLRLGPLPRQTLERGLPLAAWCWRRGRRERCEPTGPTQPWTACTCWAAATLS